MSRDRAPGPSVFTVITCEHAGRDVPEEYAHLFGGAERILASHRGYDIGALGVALRLASRVSAPIVFSTVTRLLVDLNRSASAHDVFSVFTRDLPVVERERILAAFHVPHREIVERIVSAAVGAGHRVVHLGVHSCADVLGGETRELDIALLFDDARALEEKFCSRLRASLRRHDESLRYPFNEPYRGADDGLTTTLRGRFGEAEYLGIEIELRQGLVPGGSERHAIGDLLARALAPLLGRSVVRERA